MKIAVKKSLFVLSLAILPLAACGGGDSATPAAPAKIYNIGEAIATPTYEAKILKVETRAAVGADFLREKAADGGILVAVQYSIKNVGAKPMNSFEQPRFKLVDDKNTEYDADISKSGSYATELNLDQKIMSDLNPGITVKGADTFEVSKELFNKATWKLKSSDGALISLAAAPAAAPEKK